MTLATIFASHDAWARLTALPLPPQVAYRLLKYYKQVKAEYDVVEQQRDRLIRDKAGVGAGQAATLTPASEGWQAYVVEFSAVLETASDLAPCDLPLGTVLDSLGPGGNVLSVQDLAQLEPFFAE